MRKGTSRNLNFLNSDELDNALSVILRQSQIQSFPEYDLLLRERDFSKKSPLIKFNVYLDSNNLIRVGGRLDNSDFSHEITSYINTVHT